MAEIFHYPSDLEALVVAQWPADVPPDPLAESRRAVLEVAYHASMLREEGRPVRVRIALTRSGQLCAAPSDEGPLALRFDRTRPLDVEELRRLAVAVPLETSFVGVEPDADGELRIWGIVSTGAQWLAPTWGGRASGAPSIAGTVVHVRGPARIAVHAGERFVAGLEGGRLVTLRTDVFASRWMPALFAAVRAELVARHESAREPGGPSLDESLVSSISQQMVRRALWLMREAHHGGMIVFVDADEVDALFASTLRAKYRFAAGPARTRYLALLRAITDSVARRRGSPTSTISARDFLESAGELAEAEAAVFELSRTIAALSATDGAVVLTKGFELLAFGVEIAALAPTARQDTAMRIRRALDGEGEHTIDDDEENVGTRHRAAYRFVQAHPHGLVIVVSQDGTIRFVASRDGLVTYYEQHFAG
ncbi:MAG: diadenylate cyclase [Myxococcota bacterium]|nr:diadenylate cyclase [Myxococcota bacterium]